MARAALGLAMTVFGKKRLCDRNFDLQKAVIFWRES